MHKLQARNIPSDLYDRVQAAAEINNRSLEGEVRHAIASQYPATGTEKLPQRVQWQQETADRLRRLVTQLRMDNFWRFRGPGSVVQFARKVGEASPAAFLDWLDGSAPLPFEAAERIADFTSCSADWLMDGWGSPFPVEDIGSPGDYEAFFSAASPGDYRYHLIRFPDESLYFVRHDRQADTWVSGYTGGRFYLGNGMGSGGQGNLKSFLRFLKQHCSSLRIDSHDSREDSAYIEDHHPCWLLKDATHTMTDWLPALLKGEVPAHWQNTDDLNYVVAGFKNVSV